MNKNLIIFYSRNGENYYDVGLKNLEKGNTEIFANYIKDEIGADLFKIETIKEYPKSYYQCCDEAKKELNQNARPELKKELKSIEKYDNIFIGFPIWWGTMPMAMFTQLEKLNFNGKNVIPFATHEGSGFDSSLRDLQKICKGANLKSGIEMYGHQVEKSKEKIKNFAKNAIK